MGRRVFKCDLVIRLGSGDIRTPTGPLLLPRDISAGPARKADHLAGVLILERAGAMGPGAFVWLARHPEDPPPAMTRTIMLRRLAALLAVLTAGVHTILGGMDSLMPLLAAGIDPVAEGALHASWHMVGAFLLWSAFAFWGGGPVARHFAGLWIVSALVFIAVDLWQSGPAGLSQNPQWIILGPVGLMAWFSAGRGRDSA